MGKRQTNLDTIEDYKEYYKYVYSLFEEYDKTGRYFVLILDGLEKMDHRELIETLDFLPGEMFVDGHFKNFTNCSFIISSSGINIEKLTGNGEEYSCNRWYATKVYCMEGEISTEEKTAVVNNLLENKKKELDDAVIEAITSKEEISLFTIQLMLSFLFAMGKEDFEKISVLGGNMTAINKYQLLLIEDMPSDEEMVSCALLDKYIGSTGISFMREALNYLAVSKFGLLEEDLKSLVKGYNSLDFFRFVTYFSDFFIQRFTGQYDFSHSCIRNGILRRISNLKGYSQEIIEVLSRRDDEVKLQEIVHQYILSDDKQGVVDYINNWGNYRCCGDKKFEQAANRAYFMAANALFELCKENNFSWIIQLIKNYNTYNISQEFVYFLNFNFSLCFDNSKNKDKKLADAKVKLYNTLFCTLCDLSEKDVKSENERNEIRRNIIRTAKKLANASAERGYGRNIDFAIYYYQQYIKLYENQTKLETSLYGFNLTDLPGEYSWTAAKLEKIDTREAQLLALELYEKSFRLVISKEYRIEADKRHEPGRLPDLYPYILLARKLGMLNKAIDLQLEKISYDESQLLDSGELLFVGYDIVVYDYVELANLYVEANSEKLEDKVTACCKRIALLMDKYIQVDSDPHALIVTYFRGYMTVIERLFQLKTSTALEMALNYCTNLTDRIVSKQSVLGKDVGDTIQKISNISEKIRIAIDSQERESNRSSHMHESRKSQVIHTCTSHPVSVKKRRVSSQNIHRKRRRKRRTN